MSNRLYGYNQAKVNGSWVTPIGVFDILDGRVAGQFFQESPNGDDWEIEFDGQGNATRTRTNNTGGTFQVTLSSSGAANTQLSRARNLDLEAENVVGTMTLRDPSGSTVIFNGCFIKGRPPGAFGNDRGNTVWTFAFQSCKQMLKGRDSLT